MDGLFFLIFLGIILFNIFKGKNPIKNSPKPNGWGTGGVAAAKTAQSVLKNTGKIGSARSAYNHAQATAEKVERERRRLKHKHMTQNQDLLGRNKDRIDNNRHRRTDWGARGDAWLFSKQTLSILVGIGLTVFFILRFLGLN